MRLPIGQTYEFSVRVLEESGFQAEDLHNMSNAVFGVYDVDDRSTEVFKVSTVSSEYGVIEPDFTGKHTVETTTEVKNNNTGIVTSTDTTKVTTVVENVVPGHSEDVVTTDNGDDTSTVVTTVTDDTADNEGVLRIKMTAAATSLLSENRRSREDEFYSKLAYAGILVINIDGRASLTVDIPKIDAIITPSL